MQQSNSCHELLNQNGEKEDQVNFQRHTNNSNLPLSWIINKRLPSGEDSSGTKKKRRSEKKRRTDSSTKDSNSERDEEWERSRKEVLIAASNELKKKHRHLKKYLFDVSDGSSNSKDSNHTNCNAVKNSSESNNQFSDAKYKDEDDEERSWSKSNGGRYMAKMTKNVDDDVEVAEEKMLKLDNRKPAATTSGKKSPNFSKTEDYLIAVAFVNISVDPIRGNDQKGMSFWACNL
jgi:hypothetical protein